MSIAAVYGDFDLFYIWWDLMIEAQDTQGENLNIEIHIEWLCFFLMVLKL